jgi:hypothetical protein
VNTAIKNAQPTATFTHTIKHLNIARVVAETIVLVTPAFNRHFKKTLEMI